MLAAWLEWRKSQSSVCDLSVQHLVQIKSAQEPLDGLPKTESEWVWSSADFSSSKISICPILKFMKTYTSSKPFEVCFKYVFMAPTSVLFSPSPVLCPLRPSSARSMEPSLSWAWRWCSKVVRACLSMELFISSGPDRTPDIGGRSRDDAFLSVGGTMLLTLRAPWIRPCPWQGGGSGGGGRSVPKGKNHRMNQLKS